MNIDRKYQISAVNPVSGKRHDESDSILFLAKDAAVPAMLDAYMTRCTELGSNPEHIKSIKLMRARVIDFHATIREVPDTRGDEIKNCLNGELLPDKLLSPSEAVYGFAGWLISRSEVTATMSSAHDSSVVAELVSEFCKVNKLNDPADHWETKLKHPTPKLSAPTAPTQRDHSHYFKDVSQLKVIDIYRVCSLFDVQDPSGAVQHALKKLLLPGKRGAGKDMLKDLKEARDSLSRRIEMLEEDAAAHEDEMQVNALNRSDCPLHDTGGGPCYCQIDVQVL